MIQLIVSKKLPTLSQNSKDMVGVSVVNNLNEFEVINETQENKVKLKANDKVLFEVNPELIHDLESFLKLKEEIDKYSKDNDKITTVLLTLREKEGKVYSDLQGGTFQLTERAIEFFSF